MTRLKRNVTTIAMFALMLPISLMAQDKIIPNGEIPVQIRTYIQTHFPNQAIVLAKLDRDGLRKEYEIKLDNNTELEFNGKYQIKKIDGNAALPHSVIPAEIRTYVSANYPNNTITDWETEWKHQEVKLDNGLELEFTIKGDFVRVDD